MRVDTPAVSSPCGMLPFGSELPTPRNMYADDYLRLLRPLNLRPPGLNDSSQSSIDSPSRFPFSLHAIWRSDFNLVRTIISPPTFTTLPREISRLCLRSRTVDLTTWMVIELGAMGLAKNPSFRQRSCRRNIGSAPCQSPNLS